jgi:hypothetical protein
MRNKKAEAVIIIFCGLVCIAAGCFVYLVANSIYPDSDSSRVHDLNWLLSYFGKTGTATLFAIPGLIMLYAGYRKLKK